MNGYDTPDSIRVFDIGKGHLDATGLMSASDQQRMLLHYRLTKKIGSGGMGDVYQAEDTRLGRTVAIKLLPASANDNLTAKRRFLKEAQSASALNHPNIVTIHAIEESDGLDFIVMEYIEGQTLKETIDRDGALPVAKLLSRRWSPACWASTRSILKSAWPIWKRLIA